MSNRETSESELQSILERLRADIDTSRTTLRVDIESWGVNVDRPVAEATASGVASIRDATLDQRSLATVQYMEAQRELVIQNDCRQADPAPPQALLDVYGVKAQMLAPLVRDDRLVGWISAHYTPSTRVWSDGDVRALREAAAKVQEVLRDIEVSGQKEDESNDAG